MPFDINNIPLPIEVKVWTSSEEMSYDILAKRLLELHKIMLNNKIKVDYYSIRLEEPYIGNEDSIKKPALGSEEIRIDEFPASKIMEEGLVSIIKEHQK